MSNPWGGGFKPDTSLLLLDESEPEPKKSPQEQLDEVVEQINSLEDKREELLHAVAKEEALEDDSLHEECYSEEEVKAERAEGYEEVWEIVREFGGHAPSCLSGALAGSQKLHPLCTCGWNEVATRLERLERT